MNNRIEITITDKNSQNWARQAEKMARAEAKARGIDYRDCEVFVTLPEPGRCMKKSAGYLSMQAHG